MKRLVWGMVLVVLAVSIAACGQKNGQKEKPALMVEGFPAAELAAGVYYVEGETLEGDPGENPTAEESARTAWNSIKKAGIAEEFSDWNLYIWLKGVGDLEDEYGDIQEGYLYSLEAGGEKGTPEPAKDREHIYDIGVTYDKTVMIWNDYAGHWIDAAAFLDGGADIVEDGFLDEEGYEPQTEDGFLDEEGYEPQTEDGRGDIFDAQGQSDPGDTQSDPGDNGLAAWWGEYKGEYYSIGITNFDGDSFRFTIFNLRNGKAIEEGTAAIDPNDPLSATYGTMGFYLYEDYSGLDIFSSESGEYADLRGQYLEQ